MVTKSKYVPTLTEYDGVLFRSKSEAIFARAMDLTGHITWDYEPETIDGYTVDFWVTTTLPQSEISMDLMVEYKPSRPTDAYISKLELVDQQGMDGFLLFYGSPYEPDKEIGIFTIGPGRSPPERMGFMAGFCNPVAEKLMEAKNYRFDLKDADG